jgi:hypothetical protein
MLQLLNGDLKRFGVLKYDQHQEFSSIEWKLALDDSCLRAHIAKFDIDNNGHDDVVLKQEACLQGEPDDSLFIYKEGKNAPPPPPKFVLDASTIKQSSGLIGQFPHGIYELRKLGQFREGKHEFFHHIGGIFRINPFRFGRKYYLMIDNPLQISNKDGKRFTAIALYEKTGQLNDRCYFAIKGQSGGNRVENGS